MLSLEAKLKLRDVGLAAAGAAHLKVLAQYTTELFDHAYEKPLSKIYRPLSIAEVMTAGKQAWQEALRLVAAQRGDLNSCLLRASKAGGLFSALLRPMPGDIKQSPAVSFSHEIHVLHITFCVV